jgi:hypothetical protein
MLASDVHSGKGAPSSGCKCRPPTAPAGSGRSSCRGDEIAEAIGIVSRIGQREVQAVTDPRALEAGARGTVKAGRRLALASRAIGVGGRYDFQKAAVTDGLMRPSAYLFPFAL